MTQTLKGAVDADGFSVFMVWVLAASVILTSLALAAYARAEGMESAELYVLMLFSAAGGAVIVSAADLLSLFVGIEILSISTYVLAASHPRKLRSQEAGMKYFLLGGVAAAVLLYGIALIYGATGSTNLSVIESFLAENALSDNSLMMGGIAMLIVGLAFKVGAVPFHQWAPDVYEGSPSPLVGWMAGGVKAAAFAGVVRVLVVALGPTQLDNWRPVVAVLAAASLVLGSLMALAQTNVKRMLAYSSIAHAGFLLVGIDSASDRGTTAVLFYLAVYVLLTAGSFAVVSALAIGGERRVDLDDIAGLGRSNPALAVAFAILLFAQAGVPLTGGFTAKFGIIVASVEAERYWLAILAMLASVVGAVLYLRIVSAMFFRSSGDSDEPIALPGGRVAVPPGVKAAVALSVLGVVTLGVVPDVVRSFAEDARPATAEEVNASGVATLDVEAVNAGAASGSGG